MKKFLSITTFIALVLACSLPSVASANSSSNSPAVQIQVLSNTEEGQRVAYKVKSALTQKIDEHQYVSSYEIFVPFDEAEIKPFSYVGSEKEDNGIIAKLKITYFLRSGGEEIKITNISGSWTGSISSVETKDREVAVTDGAGVAGIGSKVLRWNPTSDTFDYDTGWGYVQNMPHSAEAMTGPRGYSEVYYRIPGMGWTWQHLYFSVKVE